MPADPLTTVAAMISAIEPGFRMIDGSLLKALYQQAGDAKTAATIEPGPRLIDATLLRNLALQSNATLAESFKTPGPRLIDGTPWKALSRTATSAPTVVTAPVISGGTTLGSTLTCTTGSWTGAPTSYAYQWRRGATNIGTNQNTYVLVAGDSGNSITCVVTATNAFGSTVAPPSNAIGATLLARSSRQAKVEEAEPQAEAKAPEVEAEPEMPEPEPEEPATEEDDDHNP